MMSKIRTVQGTNESFEGNLHPRPPSALIEKKNINIGLQMKDSLYKMVFIA